MNMLNMKLILGIGLLVVLSQQAAVAGDWQNSPRDRAVSNLQQSPVFHQGGNRHEDRYYNPGHTATTLPRGYSKVYANTGEYFYANGSFYKPSRRGYVAVAAPIGAVIHYLPRYKRVTYWRGQPYYVAGNTFFRKHAGGYVVVPNPARGYRR